MNCHLTLIRAAILMGMAIPLTAAVAQSPDDDALGQLDSLQQLQEVAPGPDALAQQQSDDVQRLDEATDVDNASRPGLQPRQKSGSTAVASPTRSLPANAGEGGSTVVSR